MEKQNIYQDISARTVGEIYLGVVGPVRSGKSTFIKRFMELLVLPEIKDENIHDFDDDREFFTWELEDELESEPIEKPTNGLFSAVNLFDDYEKIEYDSSAYEDINNDDVENLKKDFLHHVYDYCFDLLISDQVTTRYKNEQLNIHNDSDEIMSEDDEIPECDEEYISATYFLNTLKNDLIENIDTDILFNNWYGKKYYRGLKHFLILFALFKKIVALSNLIQRIYHNDIRNMPP